MYNERKLRNKSFGDVITNATYNKSWDWNRMYDLKFDLAQSLTFNFNANATSYINEYPESNSIIWDNGDLNGDGIDDVITPEEKKQQVKDEILSGGTKSRYVQNVGINYNLPINKLPLLDWVTATFGYNVAYNWVASPRSMQELGNTISNNVNWNINGNADLNKLYNKIDFLKKINEPPRKRPNQKQKEQKKQTKDPNDTTKVVKPKVNYGKIAYETVLKLLMSVKKVSLQYSENKGTSLPGFMYEPTILGNDWNNNAPGFKFIFGAQPESPEYFNKEGWLSQDIRLNTSYNQMENSNLNVRLSLEPFKDLKIDLTADRTYAKNFQTLYVYDTIAGTFLENSAMHMGSFSMTYITWGTAFGGSLENEKSQYFENMKDYRYDIAHRLANQDPRDIATNDSTGYPEGYGPTSQDVLLPSFIAAYSNKDPNTVSLQPFPTIPLPNWRVSYNGLSKIPFLQSIFKSVTLNHAYNSSYNIGSFVTNINYSDTIVQGIQVSRRKNQYNGDYYSEFEYANVTITEQFSPLINIDMTFQNSLLAKFEMKKSRNLSLSFANNQLTEVSSSEFIIGLGFRFKDVPLNLSGITGGKGKTFKSDLNIKADFSIRNNKTVLRSIDTDTDQISAGQKVTSINASIDYMLSKSLTLRLFFDKITTNPFLPSQYRNSTTKGGISLRFSLAQ